jgi:hypothetical protein
MALKLSEKPLKPLTEWGVGIQIFFNQLFFPRIRYEGLPCIDYLVGVYDSNEHPNDGYTIMSPMSSLEERKELRKWWRLTGHRISTSDHRKMMHVAQECWRKANWAEKEFAQNFKMFELPMDIDSAFWRCFPTIDSLRKETEGGLWEIQATKEMATCVGRAHMAMLRFEDWAY